MELHLHEKEDHDKAEFLAIRKDNTQKTVKIYDEYIVITQYIRSYPTHNNTEDEVDKSRTEAKQAILIGVIYQLLSG